MTHWLAGSLRENCWDSTPDGGAFDAGALVVNSSQGGGGKDTWVLADETHA